MIPDRITFRAGALSGPMSRRLAQTGESPSVYVRRLISEDCGVAAPDMRPGPDHDTAVRAGQAGMAARWGHRRQRS